MEANYFTILWWFLPYIHMNQPWVYMCFPSCTPLPPPSPSHPSESSQCTNPEHPASCTKPGLAIYFTYDNIHVYLFLIGEKLLYNFVLVSAIHQHESAIGIHPSPPSWNSFPHPTPFYPSRLSSKCTSPKLPASCIEPGLEIRFLYDIIHVSTPFSQIIPRSL